MEVIVGYTALFGEMKDSCCSMFMYEVSSKANLQL